MLMLSGFVMQALRGLARIPWYVLAIAALSALCLILWTSWGRSADQLKVERAKTATLSQSVDKLIIATDKQNDAINAVATESEKRVQASKTAIAARKSAKTIAQIRINQLTRPVTLTKLCVTHPDVMKSGL